MKVTVEIDCTPAEGREFVGLPDLRPTQNAVAKKLEEQMTANLDSYTSRSASRGRSSISPA